MRCRVLIDWLEHDNQRRQVGEELDLDEQAALALRDLGAVALLDEQAQADQPVEQPEEPRTRRTRRS